MAKTFSITTTAAKTTKADPKGRADIGFEVTNSSGRPARGLAKAKALDSTKQEWLKLTGEAERDFAPGASQEFLVTFEGPVIAPTSSAEPKAGVAQASTEPEVGPTYNFRLDVANAVNPDEDFTEGPVVTVEAAVGKPAKKFPYWIIPVAAVVLIGIGVGLWWLLSNGEVEPLVEVPDVQQQLVNDATQKLTDAGFIVATTGTDVTEGFQPDQVVSQRPVGGEKAVLGSTVELSVAAVKLIEVPRVISDTLAIAKQKLAAAGLNSEEQTPELADASTQPGSIKSQNPAPGAKVPPNTVVNLVVAAPSTQVPPLIGKKVAEAQLLLQRNSLEMVVFGTFNETNATTVVITGQNPTAGSTVATGSKVTARVPCIRRDCRFILFERPLAIDRIDRIDASRIERVDSLRIRKAVPVKP